jgi:hypothetical protein
MALSVRDPNGVGYDAVYDPLWRVTSQTDKGWNLGTQHIIDKGTGGTTADTQLRGTTGDTQLRWC